MCEKPMARTYDEALKMVAAAKRSGKKLTIGYHNRFKADSQYLNKICRQGDLGEIYFAKAHAVRHLAVPNWGVFLSEGEQGGEALIAIRTHALDLALRMMNNYQPKSVLGSTFRKYSDQKDTANLISDWDPAKYIVEDSVFGFIKLENGASIYLEASWALNVLETGEGNVTLRGTKAGADMKEGLRINKSDMGKLVTIKPAVLPGRVEVFDTSPSPPSGELEAKSWIDCTRNNTDPVVIPEQALVVS
jgi:predicted dehydrogenase